MEIIVLLIVVLLVLWFRARQVKDSNLTHIAVVEHVRKKHDNELRVAALVKFYKFNALLSDGLVAYCNKQKIISAVINDLNVPDIVADITTRDDAGVECVHVVSILSLCQKEDIKCRVNNVLVSLGFVLHVADTDPELMNRWIYTTEFANSIRNDIVVKKQQRN